MLTVQNLRHNFGARDIFAGISFQINPQDRIGLVGKNGAGKSTLLKILSGEIKPKGGFVSVPKDTSVGYLKQHVTLDQDQTVRGATISGLEKLEALQKRLDEINHEVGVREDYESESYMTLLEELNEVNDKITVLGGDKVEENVEKILAGLGFEHDELDKKVGTFSGGWQMRVELARLLLQDPDVLLLDEPTNHLDIVSIEWLEGFLKEYRGAVVVISHDRTFLDNVTLRTIEVTNGEIKDYNYPYSRYLEQRELEIEQQIQAKKDQKKYVEKTQELINKFRAKKNKAAFAQSLIRKLEKMDEITVDEFDSSSLRLKFPPPPRSGKVVLDGKGVSKSFGDKEIFRSMDVMIGKGDKIALVGKNGVGKTTFIKMIVGDTQYSGKLKLGHNVEVGYYAQDESDLLDDELTVYETIDNVAKGEVRKQIRSILGSFLFSGEDVDKKVAVLSGGERARLALCKLLLRPVNFLILDEPTNHLDIAAKEVLKEALKDYEGTLLVVSHDRDFLKGLSTKIFEIGNYRIREHHNDIFDFLKSKKLESLKELDRVERAKKSKKSGASTNKEKYLAKKQRDKDYRKMNNRVNRLEREIKEMEDQLEDLQKRLANHDYEDEDGSRELFGTFNETKKALDAHMKEWEEKMALLEAYE